MAKDQKIIRAKAGLLEAAKAAWRRRPGLQDHGLLSLRQPPPVQSPYDKGGELALREMSRRKNRAPP